MSTIINHYELTSPSGRNHGTIKTTYEGAGKHPKVEWAEGSILKTRVLTPSLTIVDHGKYATHISYGGGGAGNPNTPPQDATGSNGAGPHPAGISEYNLFVPRFQHEALERDLKAEVNKLKGALRESEDIVRELKETTSMLSAEMHVRWARNTKLSERNQYLENLVRKVKAETQ